MQYNFEQFVASPATHLWIVEPGLQLYVRKNILFPGLFDLANLSAGKPGKGAYTAFLQRYAGHAFRVENVLTARFADYHRKRGWAEVRCPYGLVPSFLNKEAVQRELGIRGEIIFHESTACH